MNTQSPRDVRVEECVEAFESVWRVGPRPSIREHWSDSQSLAALVELILVDMEYCWRKGAMQPRWEDYLHQFPELGGLSELAGWLVAEEYRVRRQWGDAPDHREYTVRLPHLGADLPRLLSRVDRELLAEIDTAPPVPATLLSFDDYRLQQHLGTGGMGKVYRALDRAAKRHVAVKAILKSRQTDRAAIQRFLEEADILSRLRHRGIVGFHGVGRFPGGGYFLVMDFVPGEDLARRLARGPLQFHEAARIACLVADAIDHAHGLEVIHCDLKPANILLGDQDHPIVTDFGLARLRSAQAMAFLSGCVGGTPAFMPPEQLDPAGAPIGPRTDVFGIGAILYCMLAGRPPYEQTDQRALAAEIRSNTPIKPPRAHRADIPPPLDALCSWCLEKSPERRPETARLVAESLRAWLDMRSDA